MITAEKLSRDLDRVERQISALQDYLYEAELYPEQDRPWPRLRRSVSLFLTRRYVFHQIQQLYLRRQAIRNRYLYIYKREPEDHPTSGNASLVRNRHP